MPKKNIALVAHDKKKAELLSWVEHHQEELKQHDLFGTGSTGTMVETETGLPVTRLESGPLGGDQQLGAMIVDGKIDVLIFFWDPLESQPHDPDVRALLRIAVVWNIPIACNQSTADILITAEFMQRKYQRQLPDYSDYRTRKF